MCIFLVGGMVLVTVIWQDESVKSRDESVEAGDESVEAWENVAIMFQYFSGTTGFYSSIYETVWRLEWNGSLLAYALAWRRWGGKHLPKYWIIVICHLGQISGYVRYNHFSQKLYLKYGPSIWVVVCEMSIIFACGQCVKCWRIKQIFPIRIRCFDLLYGDIVKTEMCFDSYYY